MSEKTIVNHEIGKSVTGYMVNTLPDSENRRTIANLQSRLTAAFGDALWITPPDTLHITLMDWVAPLVDYGRDKVELFEDVYPDYNRALTDVLRDFDPIPVHFDTVRATPQAIIVTGQDNGQFQAIRSNFLRLAPLPPNTKQPPTIIHTTIARYSKEVELDPITAFAESSQLDFDQHVALFRLVREIITPQLQHTLLKEYTL